MKKAIAHRKKSDPVLGRIITRLGPLPARWHEPTFETMARSITFQQLNGKAARTIYGRPVAPAGGRFTPDSFLQLSTRQLRAVGLSKQKLTYIRDLAKKTKSGDVDFAALPKM